MIYNSLYFYLAIFDTAYYGTALLSWIACGTQMRTQLEG